MRSVGILQPALNPHAVAGTRLLDPPQQLDLSLKRDPKNVEIILQPQPSDDPNDPLNWDRWKKEAFFASLVLSTAAVGVSGPLFIPAFGSLSVELGVSIGKISQLNGILVMFIGVTSFLGIVGSGIIGKRPICLLTLAFYTAGSAWAATAKDYDSLYGARILQGLGIGAFACMGNALLSDVFFLHEMGLRTSLWQLAWVVTVSVTPLISAQIIAKSGWRTAFWGLLGLSIACLVLVVVAMPESTFIRASVIDRDAASAGASTADKDVDEKEPPSTSSSPAALKGPGRSQSRSALTAYMPFSGVYKTDSLVLTFLRPFFVLFTPPVLWSAITYSWIFTINILSGALYSQIFSAAPYNLGVETVGNISGVPPLIGSLIACGLAGPIADRTARALSRRNGGYFEPEMYLVLMVPCVVLSLAGLLGWGFSVKAGADKNVPAVMIGIVQCGLSFGYIGTILYSTAVFPSRGGDAFGIIMLVKSGMAFGMTYVVNDWYTQWGPAAFFGTLAGTSVGLSLLALPMFVFGKVLRQWTAESTVLGWTTR